MASVSPYPAYAHPVVTTTPIVPPSVVQPELDSFADRILGAAIEQFAVYGIRRTSVDDVARR